MSIASRTCAALAVPLLPGCADWVRQDIDRLRERVLEAHPVGTDAKDLEARASRLGLVDMGVPWPFGIYPGEPNQCRKRTVNIGYGGGERFICFATGADGKLTAVVVDEYVMTP